MKTILKIALVIISVSILVACQEKAGPPKIGIVLPLEHKALQSIVDGFTTKLQETYHQPLQIKVMNAQGDINIQRAIIQQMRDQHYTMIVPVGTSVTQMTLSMIQATPIVSLAAELSHRDLNQFKSAKVTFVHDEIPPEKIIAFIHAAYPHLTHLSLIHSTSDKIFPDVKKTIAAGKQLGIEIKPLMVATLPELVSISDALSSQTQGILVLKDNLIVSGISTLANAARNKHIPLFTSDQGSVEGGAAFALGVHERQIGEEGASLALAVLQGKLVNTLPSIEMTKLTVFLNKKALSSEMQDPTRFERAANQFHYPIELIGGP